jgi:hypothetical protein
MRHPVKSQEAQVAAVQESDTSGDSAGGAIGVLLSIVIFCIAVAGVGYAFCRSRDPRERLHDPDESVPFKFSMSRDTPEELARLGFSKL